jgi:GTP-binding protein
MNKWDLVEKDTNTINKFEAKLQEDLKFMSYFKSVYISAKTGQRAEKVLDMVDTVYANASRRVTIGELNDLIMDAVRVSEPPSYNGRRIRFYYTTQAKTNPPTFVFFVNDEKLMHFSYERYLENIIRNAYDFSGTPIKLVLHQKQGENE